MKRSARANLNPLLDEEAKMETVGCLTGSKEAVQTYELYSPFRDYFGLAGIIQGFISSVHREESAETVARPRQSSASSSDWSSTSPHSIGTPTCESALSPILLMEDPFHCLDLHKRVPTGRVVTNCIAQQCAEKFKLITALGRAAERQICVFCRNNGESESVYATHNLKASDGRITCPVLRAYTCPICGASGDEAHTIKYCPQNREVAERSLSRPQGRLRNATGRRK